MKASHTIHPVFDDCNLVSAAGLVPVLQLAESAGLSELLGRLTVESPNAAAKTTSLLSGMLAGADSIDDMDLLRHGGMPALFTGVRAPSTLGTFLRLFTHGHVRQLDAAGTRLLAQLADRVPGLIGGHDDPEALAFLDVDDSVHQVHGYAKQAAGFGYTGVRGLNMQIAVTSTPVSAPVITGARLRKGNTASASGSAGMLADAISASRRAGAAGQILVRADSAYYRHDFTATAARRGGWFSITTPMNPAVTSAIASIDEQAWTPIAYPHAVWDDDEHRWISDAEVAEVDFTAFTSRRKADHVDCRLVVRRVKRLQPRAADHAGQGELFAAYRHHAFITNSTLSAVEADQRHRGHAVIEQVHAELKNGPLAHLPSGIYTANAAWVAIAVIGFNLARAASVAAGMATARWATLQARIIGVPARIARTGRRLMLHLPTYWPWMAGWNLLWHSTTGPPGPHTV
ncbi:IS1380 family transposase [Tomitella gaofuii]|uniref:IS1380 family transposase n=1 Tax=Tomitella gaofuii TaxID=2760083 RepID=UPI0015F7E85F|nr:IS1380 family transposase [Tomitella gaofuii]